MARQDLPRSARSYSQSPKEMPSSPVRQYRAGTEKQNTIPSVNGTVDSDPRKLRMAHLISDAYKGLDNDLARDNMENDLPDADLQDL